MIVTTNLYGDILTDQAAGLVGGPGPAPGLNASDTLAMARATHGSTPDIAGRDLANPCSGMFSAIASWGIAPRQTTSEA